MGVGGRDMGTLSTEPAVLRMSETHNGTQVGHQKRSNKQQQRHEARPLNGAEMTVTCAMGETHNDRAGGPHVAQEVQTYLQRRVSEILMQIKSASSAHHYERHVIEISELLRCDAPMGFTPTMVLSGIPDILFALSESILRGDLLKVLEEDENAVEMPQSLRIYPVQKELNNTVVGTTGSLSVSEQEEKKACHLLVSNKYGRRLIKRNTDNTVVAAPAVEGGSSTTNVTESDLLSFLPPLVYRSLPSRTVASGQASAANYAQTVMNREFVDATSAKSYLGDKICRAEEPGCTLMQESIPEKTLEGFKTLNGLTDTTDRQLKQHIQTISNMENTLQSQQHTTVLRDIPSALQAMLYHCSLPLVCLTLEDYRQRTPALRILASAMTSILPMMQRGADMNSTTPLMRCDDVDKRDSSRSASNASSDAGSEKFEKDCSAPLYRRKAESFFFRMRHAVLKSFYALLSHIEMEELTDMNRHFAPRDKKLYKRYGNNEFLNAGIANELFDSRGEHHEHNRQLTDEETTEADVLRQGKSKLSSSSQRVHYASRVVPLSIYNNAVTVDVSGPLIEHWSRILQRSDVSHALLDSAHQLLSHSEEGMQKMGILCGATGEKEVALPMRAMNKKGATTAMKKRMCMSEQDAEEIFLLLRICLHLSSYEHHARHLINPVGDKGAASCTSLPVLLCLTMARCMDGDKCLPLCIECLWSLLDVLPEETVLVILQHTPRSGENDVKDFPGMLEKYMMTLGEFSPMLLSASESMLYTFLQILLFGHRLRERELRNDFVVLMLMILQINTRMLKRKDMSKPLQHSVEISSEPLPGSTISAISSIIIMVFDMVCGPELCKMDTTARATQRPVEMFQRYHTVLSPTTRVENKEFKVLGWRLLEAFHVWQTFRLSSQHPRDLKSQKGTIIDDAMGDKNGSILDVCANGFIHVLLMYVDTMCSNKLVVAWTREELLSLQNEAWHILLALMEVTVELPLRSTVSIAKGESDPQNEVEHTHDDMMNSSRAGDKRDIRCDDAEEVGTNGRSVSSLVRADNHFIAAGGISCVLRYIEETTTRDAESMVCLAVRLLSVLSRCPAHRPMLLAVTSLSPNSNKPVSVLLSVAVRVIHMYVQQAVEPRVAKTTSRGVVTNAFLDGDSLRTLTSLGTRASQHGLKKKGIERKENNAEKVVSSSRSGQKKVVKHEANNTPFPDGVNVHVSLAARIFDVILPSLSLLYNISEGDVAEVAATQQMFASIDGVPLLLSVMRLWLSLDSLLASCPLFNVNAEEMSNKLLCAVLACTRAFVLGNDAVQRQFVSGDGVHVLLSIVVTFALGGRRQQQKELIVENGSATHLVAAGRNVDNNEVYCYRQLDCLTLGSVLTILADLIGNCMEAKNAFLQWSMYDRHSTSGIGNEDAHINATQLLLRLWKEGPAAEVDASAIFTETTSASTYWNNKDCGIPEVKEQGGVVRSEGEKISTFHSIMSDTTMRNDILDSCDSVDVMRLSSFHPNRWGLQLLGLQGREGIKKELRSRFLELQRRESVAIGVPPPDDETHRARDRLVEALCRVLGLRVRVYACLAAVGFDTLANVKANASERVKLLHIAALPSMCEDEVWGAISEVVNLRSRVWTKIDSKRKCVENGIGRGDTDAVTGDGDNGNDGRLNEKFALIPVAADADRLVKVFHDVDARATEIEDLGRICVDMHTTHEEEETYRFFLSFLRQGSDDADTAALVAKSRRTGASTLTAGSCGGDAGLDSFRGSVVDRVMSSIRHEMDSTELPSLAPSVPTGALVERCIPLVARQSPSSMLQKRRKRQLMLSNTLCSSSAKDAGDSAAVIDAM